MYKSTRYNLKHNALSSLWRSWGVKVLSVSLQKILCLVEMKGSVLSINVIQTLYMKPLCARLWKWPSMLLHTSLFSQKLSGIVFVVVTSFALFELFLTHQKVSQAFIITVWFMIEVFDVTEEVKLSNLLTFLPTLDRFCHI